MTRRFVALGLLVGGVALALAGAAQAGEAQSIQASAAWIRVLPGNLPAGGYVNLHNSGNQAAALVAADSPAYAHVMLHESSSAGGVSRMSAVGSMVIPAHAGMQLAPGGYHLMLMQPKRPVAPGQAVTVTLHFADGSRLPVQFAARPANALDAGDSGAMH